jgi:hypothetical protein
MTPTTQTIRDQSFLPVASDIPAGLTIRQYRAERSRRAERGVRRRAAASSLEAIAELPEELSHARSRR